MSTWQELATTLIQAAGEGPPSLTLAVVLLDHATDLDREGLAMVLLRKLDPEALDRVNYYASLLTPTTEEDTVDGEPEDEGSNATAHLDVLKGGKSLTAAEIAEATGLKVETIRKRLAKALKHKLVRKLETSAPGPARWTLTAVAAE